MRSFFCLAALTTALLLPISVGAQEKRLQMTFLRVPDSLKDTEIHISKLLLERLKLNSTLKAHKNNPEDLVVHTKFNPAPEHNLPTIVMLVDTRIARRDQDSKPISQVIGITSVADLKLKEDQRGALLEWANRLNSQVVPMRVFVSGDKIVIGRNLYNSLQAPLPENAVIDSFTRLYRAWETLLVDMRKRGFLDE